MQPPPNWMVSAGSTIRLGYSAARPDACALYFICSTSLISDFRAVFADVLHFDGNRAIVVSLSSRLPKQPLKACIGAALTYHVDRAQAGGQKTGKSFRL